MYMSENSKWKIPDYTVDAVGDIATLSQIHPQHILDGNIPKVWEKSKGKNTVIAILDTGTPQHSDLNANIDLSKCRSFVDEDIFDIHSGHSTHCSGTMCAINNTSGIVGIAPDATLVCIKVLNKYGMSENNSILKGLEYCLTLRPSVINMSLGGPSPMPDIQRVIKKLIDLNIPIVCSAGNNGLFENHDVLYPANYDECIAVGAYSDSVIKNRALFSAWGNTLDIMAAGENILSTYLRNQYCIMSGTSMAAPSITAIIALIISYYQKIGKSYTVEDIRKVLLLNAKDINDVGKDDISGWGIVDPEKIFYALDVNGTVIIPKKTFWQKIKGWFGK